MKTYVQYPPRKLQSVTYTGPITLSNYQQFQWVREQLEKEGVNIAHADRKLIDLSCGGPAQPGLLSVPITHRNCGEIQCSCHVISRRPRAPSLCC